jgi:hypothetical protein
LAADLLLGGCVLETYDETESADERQAIFNATTKYSGKFGLKGFGAGAKVGAHRTKETNGFEKRNLSRNGTVRSRQVIGGTLELFKDSEPEDR